MRSRVWYFVVCLGIIVASGTSVLLAQSATTSLQGIVYDAKGAVVANANLTLTNPATGFARNVKSDGQGAYQFVELPPATYDLAVTAGGFAETKVKGVQLLVNTPASVNVDLKVATGVEVVEVSGTTALVNTVNAALGHAFDSEQIADLPFEGRDPTGILSLQPGVAYTGNSQHISSASDSRSGAVAAKLWPDRGTASRHQPFQRRHSHHDGRRSAE